jgi:Fic family protein
MPRDPPKYKWDTKKFMKLSKREDVWSFIDHANSKYLYWDEMIHRPPPEDVDEETLWMMIQFIRGLNSKKIKINGNDELSFRLSITDWAEEQLHFLDLNIGGSIKNANIPEEEREQYLISSMMEEAIASSQIEGAATTRKIAKDMLRKSRKPRNRSERMIVNNYLTIQKILEIKDNDLTPEMVKDIQTSMTHGTLENRFMEGNFRNTNDIVVKDSSTGEIIHDPPDYRLVPKFIEDLCSFANERYYGKEVFIHPIVKASILHFLIGYIHPFEDGNGRTARALFYWFLLRNDYWLAEFMAISRIIKRGPSKYSRAYIHTEKDNNDLTYFINYNIRILKMAWDDLNQYIEKKMKMKKRNDHDRLLINKGLNNRQIYVLRKLMKDPSAQFTVKEIMNTFSVVHQTARTDLMRLVEIGFLNKYEMGKTFNFHRSDEFDELMEGYCK